MFLSGLEVQNFKSLEDIKLILGKLNLFIGKNNSGKSNLLQVLVFLKQNTQRFNYRNPFDFGSYLEFKHKNSGYESEFVRIKSLWEVEGKSNKTILSDLVLFSEADYLIFFQNMPPKSGLSLGIVNFNVPNNKNLRYCLDLLEKYGTKPELSPRSYPFRYQELIPPITWITGRVSSSGGSGLFGWGISVDHTEKLAIEESNNIERLELLREARRGIERSINNTYALFEPRFIQKIKYNLSQIKPPIVNVQTIGEKGEFISNILTLKNAISPETEQQILFWAKKFGLEEIETNILENHLVELVVNEKGIELPVALMGAGSRKALSLIASSLVSNPESILLIEEPENGLHPEYQALMMDFFIEQMEYDKQLLITTHSEHLLTRLQRRIAEKRIKPEDVRLFWVYKDNFSTKIEPVEIDQLGIFPEGLKTYLEFTKEELRAINKARDL